MRYVICGEYERVELSVEGVEMKATDCKWYDTEGDCDLDWHVWLFHATDEEEQAYREQGGMCDWDCPCYGSRATDSRGEA